jgi:hypothetical protein
MQAFQDGEAAGCHPVLEPECCDFQLTTQQLHHYLMMTQSL